MVSKSTGLPLPTTASLRGWRRKTHKAISIVSARALRNRLRCILGLFVLVNVIAIFSIPGRLAVVTLGGQVGPLLRWHGAKEEVGGLRLVVFGTPDLGMRRETGGALGDKSWTEHLCTELRCASYQSLVPAIDGKTLDPAFTSNSAYNTTLNYVHLSHDASIPGYDYTFLNSQYPLPVHDDLETQVNKFLESKPPRNPPKETLWIFNFGFWDIWALSSMPREIAEVAINRTVSDMFQQIEILYKASLVESSIAFSDFWGYSDPDIIEKLENNQLSDVRGEREMFRVLIPRVVDPSITPGWESMRPRPPSPHSLAVHMTNAAYLTERWNDALWLQMDRWEKLPNPVPAESIATGSERAEARKRDVGPGDWKRSAADTRNRENKQQQPSFDLEPLLAPFPRRQSMDFNGFNFVREVLIEGQFRGAGFTDMLGRGQRAMESLMYYDEAWRPCSEGDLDAAPRLFSQRKSSNENGTCASPDNFFWDTPFLLGNKAAHTLARFAATEASIRLSL